MLTLSTSTVIHCVPESFFRWLRFKLRISLRKFNYFNRLQFLSISKKYFCPEMEFLDTNNLTKDKSLLLHAIHSPFYFKEF